MGKGDSGKLRSFPNGTFPGFGVTPRGIFFPNGAPCAKRVINKISVGVE
jgi:hypothetical protein